MRHIIQYTFSPCRIGPERPMFITFIYPREPWHFRISRSQCEAKSFKDEASARKAAIKLMRGRGSGDQLGGRMEIIESETGRTSTVVIES